jgi:hypothetical protein
VLALLLAVDLALIVAHLLWGYDDWFWDIEADTGYPETFQYLKWAAATLLLLILAWKRRATIYTVWAALFLYLLLDDSQSIHERSGGWLSRRLNLDEFEEVYRQHFEYFFLQAHDFGELIFAAAVAATIAVALYFSWPGIKAKRERSVTKWLVGWVFLFAFFAVGVDMLHVMAWEIYPPAIDLLLVVEDGGEMICASLLVAGLTFELSRA